MQELIWETIPHNNGFVLRRVKVFGGWLVSAISEVQTNISIMEGYIQRSEGYEWRTSITFVPDHNHEWKI